MGQGHLFRRGLVVVGTVVASLAPIASAQAGTTAAPVEASALGAPAPAPMPVTARLGKPTSIVAVGDSITQATGTGALSKETPQNSWATGAEVNSIANRLSIPTNRRYNLSTNGDEMIDFAPQIRNGKSGGSGDVAAAPSDTGLVLVEFGGNDLCDSSISSMTSTTNYRSRFKAGLAEVALRAPDALIQVMSVPDIYNLWYIRGAPQHATYHPEPESGQASGINGARFYWGFEQFPCQSLLDNADSYAQADRDRRNLVRTRTKEFNQILAEECSKVLRCRFDDNQLFNLTSNRVTAPDGPLLPYAQWAFTDMDISRNTSFGCPIPGLLGGGCGDHFHPSKQGQGKLADIATVSGYDWSDSTLPGAGAAVLASGRPDGTHRLNATVRFSGSDNVALRGQEVRVHRPDATVSQWTPHIGVAPDMTITDLGTTYVEVRSFDVNGNRGDSVVTAVEVLPAAVPTAPGAPTIMSTTGGMVASWSAPNDDGASPVTSYVLRTYVGTDTPVLTETIEVAPSPSLVGATAGGKLATYTVAAKNAVGEGPQSAPSAVTLAPFTQVSAFVNRQHGDFAPFMPSQVDLESDVAAVVSGELSPSEMTERLRLTPWFDGAYGPSIRLYSAYFLRNPDPSGLEYWATRRRNGTTMAAISQNFANSSEFRNRYGSLTNAGFVDQLYRNVFDREPDPSGRAFYLKKLTDKTWNRGQVVLQFSESSEYKRQTDGIVTVVEYARAMLGKAPNAILTTDLLVAYEVGGAQRVFEAIMSSVAYRTRVLALS